MANTDELNRQTTLLRSLITSKKGPCTVQNLKRDYKSMVGEDLKFRQFGFKSVEDFLTGSGAFVLNTMGDSVFVTAVQNEKSKHIASLVRNQKRKEPIHIKKRVNLPPNFNRLPTPIRQFFPHPPPVIRGAAGLGIPVMKAPGIRTSGLLNRANEFFSSNAVENPKPILNPAPEPFIFDKEIENLIIEKQKIDKSQNSPFVKQNGKKDAFVVGSAENANWNSAQSENIRNGVNKKVNGVGKPAQRPFTIHNPSQPKYNGFTKTDTSSKSSIQNRLHIKVPTAPAKDSDEHSAGNSPQTSPLVSSAGSEKFQKALVNGVPEFVPRKSVKPKPTYYKFDDRLDAQQSLEQYCEAFGYEAPDYYIAKSRIQRTFTCRVTVNKVIYSTYPKEFKSEEFAKEACAELAVQTIADEQNRNQLSPWTESDDEFINQLHMELMKHPSGLLTKNLPEMFKKTFKRNLPDNWFQILQTSHKFILEKEEGVQSFTDVVIVYANMDDTESEHSIIEVESIELPWHKNSWNVYVTKCMSTAEVWGRIFGEKYSEAFYDLMNEMENYMENNSERPVSVFNRQLYLINVENEWSRVRVVEMDKKAGTALCFFIDIGASEWICMSQLYICSPDFAKLPAQAVHFSLYGLEDYADYDNACTFLNNTLTDKTFVVRALTRQSEFFDRESKLAGKVQAVFFDTSSDEDVNLNETLIEQIGENAPIPELDESNVTNVSVTHINDAGDVYVQILNSDSKFVQKLINKLVSNKIKCDAFKVTPADINTSTIYLINDESTAETTWYRGALDCVTFLPTDTEFDILYVDYGYTRRTHISKMYRLQSLSMALSKFPCQSVRTKLYNIPPINDTILGRMRALMPPNSDAMVKVVDDQNDPILVKMYQRMENGSFSTVNDTIRLEHELSNSFDDIGKGTPRSKLGFHSKIVPNTIKPNVLKSKKESTMASPAKVIPDSPRKVTVLRKLKDLDSSTLNQDYMEAQVVLANNPSDFVIQPYARWPELFNLVKELTEYCKANDVFIQADMVEIGQSYAVLHGNDYHRVEVVNTYNHEMIHVLFVDTGAVKVVPNSQLKLLPAKFRELPKMAVNATLLGVAPKAGHWKADDCQRFCDLVVGKKFVATIDKTIRYDETQQPPKKIYGVELINTDTDVDIYISKILVEEDRAFPIL